MTYSFLSSYAHSESGSVLQTSQMYHDRKEQEFADNSIQLLLMVSARMIEAYLHAMEAAKGALDEYEMRFIGTWAKALQNDLERPPDGEQPAIDRS